MAAYPASRLLVVMDLCAEQRLAYDAYDDLLAVAPRAAGSTAGPIILTQRADNAGRQRVGEVLRVDECIGTISTVPLGLLLRVGLLSRAVAS